MKNLREGLRWLDQAFADLKTARDCLKDGNFYATAFFAQQAAEKALKGFFTPKDIEPLSLIHGKELDKHYIASTYLIFILQVYLINFINEEISQKFLNYAESILNEVKKYLREGDIN